MQDDESETLDHLEFNDIDKVRDEISAHINEIINSASKKKKEDIKIFNKPSSPDATISIDDLPSNSWLDILSDQKKSETSPDSQITSINEDMNGTDSLHFDDTLNQLFPKLNTLS